MLITKKHISMKLTQEDMRLLTELISYFEETQSQTIRRALMFLHNNLIIKKEEKFK